jgi:RNA polymerase sigma factor (sigma-70 family)
LKTTVLPGGSVVPLVEIKFIRVQKHFWSDKCYVELEFRNGTTRSVVERLSHQEAVAARQELIEAIQLAYDEKGPFEHGQEMGRADGVIEGRSSGLKEGRATGYQQGYSDGRSEGFNQGNSEGYEHGLWQGRDQGATEERARILGQITDMRETLVREQRWGEPVPRRSEVEGELQDWLVDEGESQETRLGERRELGLLCDVVEKAMTHLNDRERHILSERRLRENPATLEDLSRQYDISPERVRQIEVRAFRKLQKAIKAVAVETFQMLQLRHAISALTDVAQAIQPEPWMTSDE